MSFHVMNKKPLSIVSVLILIIVIFMAIGYAVSQFYNVEKRLNSTTQAIFHKTVEASYDIIDTTVNESLKNYLRGVAFTVQQIIEVTHDKQLHLNDVQVKRSIDELVTQTRVGKSGYISVLNSSGKYISHPYMKNVDVSDFDFIQQQLANNRTFLEYKWKNPNDHTSRLKVAYSIKIPDGNVIGASVYKNEMLELVDKNLLKDKLRRYNYGKTGYIYVVDSSGKLILHPTSEGKPIRTLIGDSTDKFMSQAQKKPNGTFSYPLLNADGTTEIKTVAYKYYPYLDWIIASGISQQELSKPTDQLWHSLTMAIFSLLLVIGGLILGLNSRHQRLIMIEKTDFLTGLINRRTFMEYAQNQEEKQSSYSIIIFDIDKFKAINDTYGHNEGDKAIVETAKILKQYESKQAAVSRHGGEEFVILLPDIEQDEAYQIAENIRQQVSEISNLQTRFTISAGVYENKDGKDGIKEAISYADQALYRAKQSGRNKVMIYQAEFDEMAHDDKN